MDEVVPRTGAQSNHLLRSFTCHISLFLSTENLKNFYQSGTIQYQAKTKHFMCWNEKLCKVMKECIKVISWISKCDQIFWTVQGGLNYRIQNATHQFIVKLFK